MHDDGNAARLATVHRQLTVAQNGEQVVLRIAIAGRTVTVPTTPGSLLLWYGWMPHESLQIGLSKKRGPSHAPVDGLELDERAYVTTYTRMSVEQFAEAVSAYRTAAGEGGLNPAPMLLPHSFEQEMHDEL